MTTKAPKPREPGNVANRAITYPLTEEVIITTTGPHPNSTRIPPAPYTAGRPTPTDPRFPPKVFHRIRPPINPDEISKMLASNSLGRLGHELTSKFGVGHGLILARGNGDEPGQVEALGIVTGILPSGERKVAWTPIRFELKASSRSGGHFWRQEKPTFRFAQSVADDMRLVEEFRSRCKDPFEDS